MFVDLLGDGLGKVMFTGKKKREKQNNKGEE